MTNHSTKSKATSSFPCCWSAARSSSKEFTLTAPRPVPRTESFPSTGGSHSIATRAPTKTANSTQGTTYSQITSAPVSTLPRSVVPPAKARNFSVPTRKDPPRTYTSSNVPVSWGGYDGGDSGGCSSGGGDSGGGGGGGGCD